MDKTFNRQFCGANIVPSRAAISARNWSSPGAAASASREALGRCSWRRRAGGGRRCEGVLNDGRILGGDEEHVDGGTVTDTAELTLDGGDVERQVAAVGRNEGRGLELEDDSTITMKERSGCWRLCR